MHRFFPRFDVLVLPIVILLMLSLIMLRSIAPNVFPQYFVYIGLAVLFFVIFQKIEFETLTAFSPMLYFGSIALLLLPIILGEVTRGTIRWIPIGNFTLQPAEIVRPFLILFFATYFGSRPLTATRVLLSIPLMALPLALIFLQPSLGVTILTLAGFGGVVFSLGIPRKYVFAGIFAFLVSAPLLWMVLAPYQQSRVLSLLSPHDDPTGSGYNSIQSVIAVGSGMISGKGLGNGVQTQLSFLPEKHTDFMFAAISEELGFVGAIVTISTLGFLLHRLVSFIEKSPSTVMRAYLSGIFATLLLQIFVHIGMNMGMLPITGLPLPLVSYGGSSLLSTMIMLALALQVMRNSATIQSI